MEQAHSRYGGSIASRWMNCPGSVGLCSTVPSLPSSAYASEGTNAHGLAQYALCNALSAIEVTKVLGPRFTGEMAMAVQVYLDAVRDEIAKSKTAELYVEQRFTFGAIGDGEEVYGSNDALVYHPEKGRLVVFDYKHGVGVSVSAEDNAQLKFYAAGALLSHPEWRVGEVELVIVQPRARDAEDAGAVKVWPMDPVGLIDFADEIEKGVKASKAQAAPLNVGPWCRWCDAAAVCPAREARALAAMEANFSDVTVADPASLPEPSTMDAERIAAVLKGLTVLEGWANQVREFAEAHLIAGTLELPGWKVVQKIGRAKWVEADEEIGGYLSLMWGLDEDDVRPRKLATITAVEKMMKTAGAGADDIGALKEKFTIKESSGLTIAPAGDRRDAVDSSAKAFDGVKI